LSDHTWPEICVPTEKSQYIQIGKLLIVQLDSSSISDKPESAENEKFWEQEFKEIEKTVQASSAKQVWLITHKPIVGLTLDEKKELTSLNNNLQKAFSKTTLSKKVDFMIAGHIHNSQFLSVGNLPKQIIVGHSGTSLNVYKNLQNRDKVLSTPINGLKINDFFSDTKSPKDFGYAVMTQAEDGVHWKLDFKNAEGKITYSYPISKIQ
ncbi:MAG: hypothetical protein ACXWRE_09085, partial [Pseudobdellovibrionaceae bacterium]